MLDPLKARDVTLISVRSTGNLYPVQSYPIELQMTLDTCRIKTTQQLEELKTRILKNLLRLKPPSMLNKEHLRVIDSSTQVGVVINLVKKADPVGKWLKR